VQERCTDTYWTKISTRATCFTHPCVKEEELAQYRAGKVTCYSPSFRAESLLHHSPPFMFSCYHCRVRMPTMSSTPRFPVTAPYTTAETPSERQGPDLDDRPAETSTEEPPAKRKRQSRTTYGRKRSLAACEICRMRKAKCDNVRPSCSRCQDLKAQCVYRTNTYDHSTWACFLPAIH
jgi:hypothetical protein